MVSSRTFPFATVLLVLVSFVVLLHGSKALSLSGRGGVDDVSTSIAGKSAHLLPRLYVGRSSWSSETGARPPPALTVGAKVPLTSDQSHYVTKVLRLFRKRRRRRRDGGDETDDDDAPSVRVFDGASGEWLARLTTSDDDDDDDEQRDRRRRRPRRRDGAPPRLTAECRTLLRTQDDDDDDDAPWVYFAPVRKPVRLRTMVEKCTELGAAAFRSVVTNRTEPSDDDDRDDDRRWRRLSVVAEEAAEQSERLTVPTVRSLARRDDDDDDDDLERLLRGDHGDRGDGGRRRVLLVCRERSSEVAAPILRALDDVDGTPVAVLVGPEGGWDAEEEALFDRHCRRSPETVRSVSLGPAVLRAETAAVAAVAAWALHRDSRRGVNGHPETPRS